MEVILRDDVQARPPRRSGEGRRGLRAQLPAAARPGAAGHRVEQGDDREGAQGAPGPRRAKEKAEFESLAQRIATLRFIAPRKVGENDVLYGSVTSGDVAEFLKAKGIEIDKRKVQLDEPIKKLGEAEVKIKLHPEVTATLKLLVTKEG